MSKKPSTKPTAKPQAAPKAAKKPAPAPSPPKAPAPEPALPAAEWVPAVGDAVRHGTTQGTIVAVTRHREDGVSVQLEHGGPQIPVADVELVPAE